MDGRNLIPIAHDGSSAVGRKKEREDSLIDRQIQYRTQIHCQQKSPIGSYTEMDIIVGLKCICPLLIRRMHILFQKCKNYISDGLQGYRIMWYDQIGHPSPYS